jgi:CBS domain-containing protein
MRVCGIEMPAMTVLAHAAAPGSTLADGAARLRAQIGAAHDAEAQAAAARSIRELAIAAVDAGDEVLAITRCISELNDALTIRVVHDVAAVMAMDLSQACWLTFGSQGRCEQTIATDQDNGLVFAAGEQARWLSFGARVNQLLAAIGFPLCSGQVMAGQPLCCLPLEHWCARFEHWLAHGSGNDIFAARIYFDLRPLTGELALADPLLALLRSPAARTPRFVKQLADTVLRKPVPLTWLGAVATEREGKGESEHRVFDLKQGGTALYVDAARLWALAHGVAETATDVRLARAAAHLHVPPHEAQAWCRGFEALQRLRLQVQRGRGDDEPPEARNRVRWDALDAAQRDMLKRALRTARLLQQRIAMDYQRV